MNLVKRLAWILALTIYAALFLEAFIRLANPQVIEPRNTMAAPWGVRQNIPDARYRHQTPRKTITFAINSQGMRDDREFPVAKPPGTCRVQVYGDSFFMGYEVDLQETFARRLQQRLRDAGFRAEVMNLSVSGFGQAEMLVTYRAQGRRFRPDAVISSWHYTDLDDNLRSGLFTLKSGHLAETGAHYLPSVALQAKLGLITPYVWLSENSQLFAYAREHGGFEVRKLLAALRKDKQVEPVAAAPDAPSAGSVGQKALSVALLRDFQEEARADGAHFLAVDIPRWRSGYVLEPAAPLLGADVWRDVPIISPLHQFEAIKASGRKAYFDRGGAMHMTPLANDDLAAMVARRLIRLGWLAGCAEGNAQ